MKTYTYLVSLFLAISSTVFSQVEKITFTAPFSYPEGVAVDPKTGNYYVSSVKTGTIGRVDPKGIYTEFYKDEALKSTFGMKIDAKNRLWVCAGDPNYSLFSDSSTFKKMAKIVVIGLGSGEKVMETDLGALSQGKHFPNDITFDNKGNAYVTDSFSPIIYKVDSKGKGSVFTRNDKFKSIDVGLNGIVFHPNGYLLVAHSTNGSIFKIMLDDPTNVKTVSVSNFFPGADGLLLDEKNNLVLVQNKGVDKIFLLTSKDNWSTAAVESMTFVEDRFQHPTTATRNKDGIYALNSKMNELSDSTRSPSKEFSIQKAMFKPAN